MEERIRPNEIDISKFFEQFVKSNVELDNAKDMVLEGFRKKEEYFKYYIDAISELEKEKSKSNIDSYATLSEDILNELKSSFSPDIETLPQNIRMVEKTVEKLREHREEVSKLSRKFKQIEGIWHSFIKRNEVIDPDSVFIHDTTKEIIDLKGAFASISRFEDLTRVEEATIDLSHRIQKMISMIETLLNVLHENEFIGKEPAELKKRIEDFITDGYKDLNAQALTNTYLIFEDEIEFYKNELTKRRVRAKVIKIMTAANPSIYNYGIEYNGHLIHVSEKLSDDEIYEDTGEYVYIDNFPVYGIVPLKVIQEDIEVADDQFLANAALQNVSMNLFIITLISSAFIASMTLFGDMSPFYSIMGVGIAFTIFTFIFQGLKYRINSKYNMPSMFYFHKVSYIFTKIGDDGLPIQKVVPKILVNFNKLIDNEYTIFDEDFENPFDERRKKNDEENAKIIEERKSRKQNTEEEISLDDLSSQDEAETNEEDKE